MLFENIEYNKTNKESLNKNFAPPENPSEISLSLRRRMARGAAPSKEKFPISKNEVIRNEISSGLFLYVRIFFSQGGGLSLFHKITNFWL